MNRGLLRRQFRDKRLALDSTEQADAASALVTQCEQLKFFSSAKNVALYLANDGEIDPGQVIRKCWQDNKKVLLPVLHPFNKNTLLFTEYTAGSTMHLNRFGIPEPELRCQQICPLDELDIIFTPLVAFDGQLNRMGMGGGFYDRTLVPIKRDNLAIQVVGLAHDCQQAERIPVENWDIPLSTIVTPSKVFSSKL